MTTAIWEILYLWDFTTTYRNPIQLVGQLLYHCQTVCKINVAIWQKLSSYRLWVRQYIVFLRLVPGLILDQYPTLFQILSDVLAEVDAKNKIDIREEEADSTAIRILGMLRILKYKPPDEISLHFRQGMVEGQKQVIYPVLSWLLSRIPELKKRAYLAKYLVKVDVPPEVAADPDVSELFDQYDGLIDEFKTVHKEMEMVKNSGYSTAELRKDIEEMEKEKDIVEKRIERMQRKVEGA